MVEWKDGSSIWIPLKYLKAYNPVELAEYASGNRLYVELAFKWWLRHVLRRRNIIISKVKAKYWRKTHKFGIRFPKSVNEALSIYKENGKHCGTPLFRKKLIIFVYLLKLGRRDHCMTPGVSKSYWDINKSVAKLYFISI